MTTTTEITIGVLALQGAFIEHINLLRQAADDLHLSSSRWRDDPLQRQSGGVDHDHLLASHHQQEQQQQDGVNNRASQPPSTFTPTYTFSFTEVRTPAELAICDALIIPGGESTSISLIAERTNLLEPLRDFVKVQRRPTWGTCAGLILLAEAADKSKSTGQQLIGGLDVRVQRNYFGRQVESFEADLDLSFLGEGEVPFHTVFIRAPVVAKVLQAASSTSGSDGEMPLAQPDEETVVVAPAKQATKAQVEVLGRLPGRAKTIKDRTTTAEELGEDGDIVAVRQGNVFGTAFHPELTGDARIHGWWLREVVKAVEAREGV